ncbi:MAG TPA: hypothetical protein VK745_00610 [Polyangiaceae bacterium]|jgi:hypothetical protein|nr:hypothetical protein [Polyangiaceae bacterium]
MPPEAKVHTAFRIRLAILVGLLALTVLWALHDIYSRRARTEWERPVSVAVALVQLGPVDQAGLDALHARFSALETRFASEYHRYGGQLARPITFTVYGPVNVDRTAPADPDGSIPSLAQHAYDLWRWTHAVDEGSGLPTRDFDSRIYLVVRAPHERGRQWVEGSSELGGRVGVARVELDVSSVDLALFVVSHEFLHTLGASDKYDATGNALVPDGLVEPDRVPRYPQRYAEVMARNLVLGPGNERPPESIAELGVGIATAREINWAAQLPAPTPAR